MGSSETQLGPSWFQMQRTKRVYIYTYIGINHMWWVFRSSPKKSNVDLFKSNNHKKYHINHHKSSNIIIKIIINNDKNHQKQSMNFNRPGFTNHNSMVSPVSPAKNQRQKNPSFSPINWTIQPYENPIIFVSSHRNHKRFFSWSNP